MQRNQAWVAAGVIALVFVVAMGEHVLALTLAPVQRWFEALPGTWKVICIFMMPISVIALAMAVKGFETWRARSWIAVPGKIVSAKAVKRKVVRSHSSTSDEDYEMKNFAEIIYAYEVGGRALKGDRLSIGSDLGNFEVAEKLKRYKAGAAVTVYYDPRKPERAVIERDTPDGLWKVGAGIVGGLTALVFGVVFGASWGAQALQGQVADPRRAPIVMGLVLFAGAIALFGWALKRQAAGVGGWKQVTGRILGSEVEGFQAGRERIAMPSRTLQRQRITYGYRVVGVDYVSDRVIMGARTSSSVAAMEQAQVRRYPVGKSVTVFYDPANPSQAVLERGVRLIWLVWGSAALFAGLALYLARLPG